MTRTLLSVSTLLSPADGLGADAEVNVTFQELFNDAVASLRVSTQDETFDLNVARSRLMQRFSAVMVGLSSLDTEVRDQSLADLAAFCEHLYNELA